jgi:hypothetical protein
MNNWCICWFVTHIFTGILIFKGLTARRLYKSFGIKGLMASWSTRITNPWIYSLLGPTAAELHRRTSYTIVKASVIKFQRTKRRFISIRVTVQVPQWQNNPDCNTFKGTFRAEKQVLVPAHHKKQERSVHAWHYSSNHSLYSYEV